MSKQTLNLMVAGGKATPAPPVGPALAVAKMDIGKVIGDINEKTKGLVGIQVPVKITIDTDTKDYEIEVGTPPVSQLIKKELKTEKLSKTAWKEDDVAGNLSMDQIVSIAKAKGEGLGHDLKKAVKMVIGTCVSCGVTVEEKNPKDVQKEVDEGKWDSKFQ